MGMTARQRQLSVLGVLVLVLSMSAAAAARAVDETPAAPTETDVAELKQQLRALQQRVKELEAKQNTLEQQQQEQARATSGPTAAEVDATTKAVLEDADRRSRFMAVEGFTAGFDNNKFVVRSADGNFSISPVLQWQFRSVTTYRETVGTSGGDHVDNGFENRRTKIGIEGNVVSPDLMYRFVFAAERTGGSLVTDDAIIKYRFQPDWAVRGGQFKDPWMQEESMSDTKQLAVERSLINALIGGGNTERIQGVALSYENAKPWRGQVVIHDGANSRNTNFQDGPASATPLLAASEDYGSSGRLEYFVKGKPKQYEDFSALGNKEDLLVFGIGTDFTQGGDNSELFHTADAQYETASGWGFFAQYTGLYRDIVTGSTGAAGVAPGNFYDYGFLVQAGYMITPKFEVFARYDWTQLDSQSFTAARTLRQDQVSEITIGTNYYIWNQNAKLTLDLSYLPDGVPSDLTGLGYLASDDNEFVLRGQFTLAL